MQIKHTSPIEREFEAWIVSGIEEYFEVLGIAYAIFAVSPNDEPVWPADERVTANGKVFGLQFKQAKLSNSTQPLPAQLKWSFHRPPAQFNQVVATSEIYYCLPTFVNREYRKRALEHCIFWRPDPNKPDKNAWYDNPKAVTPYNKLEDAMRWGYFMEQVFNCSIGRKITSAGGLTDYVNSIQRRHPTAELASEGRLLTAEEEEALYVVAVSLES